MRSEMNRWDIGPHPVKGAKHPFLRERYSGSQFALLFDRQWEFLCAARDNDTLGPGRVLIKEFENVYESDAKHKHLLQNWEEAWQYADYLVNWDTNGVQNLLVLEGDIQPLGFHPTTRSPRSLVRGDMSVLQDTIRKIEKHRKGPFVPDANDRANWIVDGVVRYGGNLPHDYAECVTVMAAAVGTFSPGEGATAEQIDQDFRSKRLVSLVKSRISALSGG